MGADMSVVTLCFQPLTAEGWRVCRQLDAEQRPHPFRPSLSKLQAFTSGSTHFYERNQKVFVHPASSLKLVCCRSEIDNTKGLTQKPGNRLWLIPDSERLDFSLTLMLNEVGSTITRRYSSCFHGDDTEKRCRRDGMNVPSRLRCSFRGGR